MRTVHTHRHRYVKKQLKYTCRIDSAHTATEQLTEPRVEKHKYSRTSNQNANEMDLFVLLF